jgi:hypothetical protein
MMRIHGSVAGSAWFITCGLALALGAGCDDGDGGTQSNTDVFTGGGGGAPGDAGAGGAGGGATGGGAGGGGPGPARLILSYVRSVQPRGGAATPEVSLWAYDFDREQEFELASPNGVVNCDSACSPSPDLSHAAWIAPDMGGGLSLWIAPIDRSRLQVQEANARKVADDVQNFAFADDLLVYKQSNANNGFDIVAEPKAGCGEDDACPSLVAELPANGDFRVTDFGSLIILIRTDLSSMTLDFVNLDNQAQQNLTTLGEPGGTGSQFSARDPIALWVPTDGSLDSKPYVAVFTKNEFIWRARTIEVDINPAPPQQFDLWNAPTNMAGSCLREPPYDFTDVVQFNPRFSADGEWIYFLANGDCARREGNSNREDYDIMRINRNLQGPVEDVTKTLGASHWSNHEIRWFDLSKDGESLAFTAPRPDDATSFSIWLIDPNDGSYDCSRGVEKPGLDERIYCEFIWRDVADAAVVHRSVRFHEVGGN